MPRDDTWATSAALKQYPLSTAEVAVKVGWTPGAVSLMIRRNQVLNVPLFVGLMPGPWEMPRMVARFSYAGLLYVALTKRLMNAGLLAATAGLLASLPGDLTAPAFDGATVAVLTRPNRFRLLNPDEKPPELGQGIMLAFAVDALRASVARSVPKRRTS